MLRYPGDPLGAPEEIYNCRCTMATVEPPEILQGEEPRMTYQEWVKTKEGHEATKGKYTEKVLDNGDEGGIINLNRSANRRSKNIGAFSNLSIPLQKKSVLSVCKKYNIDTKGITFKIQRSEKLLTLPFYGSTDYNNVGRIDLFPNAFVNEDELLKTIIHEQCHVMQLKKYGKFYVQSHISEMEKTASRFEEIYYNIKKGK